LKKIIIVVILLAQYINAEGENKHCKEVYSEVIKIIDKEITYEKISPIFLKPMMEGEKGIEVFKEITKNDEALEIRKKLKEKLKYCKDDNITMKKVQIYMQSKMSQIAMQALPMVMANSMKKLANTKLDTDLLKQDVIPIKETEYVAVEGVKGFIDFSFINSKHNYRKEVRLYAGYKNNTKKTIYGVISQVIVTNVFGDIILDSELKDEVKILPGKRYKPSHYRSWNSHSNVYKKLWRAVDSKTYKAEIIIKKVIFKDGTTLGN